ncbi:MAG: radical SAM protein [Desulfobacterales bacterium]|nr:radical SAM protein [Desulfobacterales bacterium]
MALKKILLVQLPVPQITFEQKTGNIPLGAACIANATKFFTNINIEILPQSISTYLSDYAIIELLLSKHPDIIGFTIYNWNIERSIYLSSEIKKNIDTKIIFGGPEITPDNPLIYTKNIDFLAFGEGESLFLELIKNNDLWGKKQGSMNASNIFKTSKSPYLLNILEPEIEDVMLIETQRGCPYKCKFCYYNKANDKLISSDTENIIEAIKWASQNKIKEVYLLDPSLNTRFDIKELLKNISKINIDRKLSFTSEIRAEFIDISLAEMLYKAGFTELEIGLQSTNKKALKLMNRKTDLKAFSNGIKNLQKFNIIPKIDIIVGLPGDNLKEFKKTVDFVSSKQMGDNIQVFPLSVLPGTAFRKESAKLGLKYYKNPPYAVYETPDFSYEDMALAFEYAEQNFNVSLNPMPSLDLSYKKEGYDIWVYEGIKNYFSKIILKENISLCKIEKIAKSLTYPYQIIFIPALLEKKFMLKAIQILTSYNPFTPLEIIFINPLFDIYIEEFESYIQIKKPHFLDFNMYGFESGPVLFSISSTIEEKKISRDIIRQIFLWKNEKLPDKRKLEKLFFMDGILIDNIVAKPTLMKWQDEFSKIYENLPMITFADICLQKRWATLTSF